MHLDWSTLALQTVNVLILLWLLKRFLFRPVTEMIAARRQAADTLLAEAETAREEAKAKTAELERRIEAHDAAAEALRAAAAAAADAERTHRLAETNEEIERLRNAAASSLRRDRARLRRDLEAEAGRLAGMIAARLLGRVPGPAATAAILTGFGEVLATLPAPQRAALAAETQPIEVITATPLTDTEKDHCTALLRQHLAVAVAPRYRADPALLAGIDLRGSHAMLRYSWQAELERITQDLARDDADNATALA